MLQNAILQDAVSLQSYCALLMRLICFDVEIARGEKGIGKNSNGSGGKHLSSLLAPFATSIPLGDFPKKWYFGSLCLCVSL